MAIVGRKPVDINLLIFWEYRWWKAFSCVRDGAVSEEIDEDMRPPEDREYSVRPMSLKNPGSIHDWEKKARETYLSGWKRSVRYTPDVHAGRDLWEALKLARTVRQVRIISRRCQLGELYDHASSFCAP